MPKSTLKYYQEIVFKSTESVNRFNVRFNRAYARLTRTQVTWTEGQQLDQHLRALAAYPDFRLHIDIKAVKTQRESERVLEEADLPIPTPLSLNLVQVDLQRAEELMPPLETYADVTRFSHPRQ